MASILSRPQCVHSSYMANAIVSDGLVMKAAKTSASMVLTKFSWNILASVSNKTAENLYVLVLYSQCLHQTTIINSLWPNDAIWWQVGFLIGSGNGLLNNGTKSFPQLMPYAVTRPN